MLAFWISFTISVVNGLFSRRNIKLNKMCFFVSIVRQNKIQYTLDLRKPDLRKNLDLRKIVGATNFLVHKLLDLRKIF